MARNRTRMLSPKEIDEIRTIPPGRGHWLRRVLKHLEVGQAYFVDRVDWNWMNKTPRAIITDLHQKTKLEFKFEEEASGNGWVITRLG
jgi:hypothetical protein